MRFHEYTPRLGNQPITMRFYMQEPESCEQISPQLFESTMHTLLRVLRESQGNWEARKQRDVAAYSRGLQLLLSGYGKDIHEVRGATRWEGGAGGGSVGYCALSSKAGELLSAYAVVAPPFPRCRASNCKLMHTDRCE